MPVVAAFAAFAVEETVAACIAVVGSLAVCLSTAADPFDPQASSLYYWVVAVERNRY